MIFYVVRYLCDNALRFLGEPEMELKNIENDINHHFNYYQYKQEIIAVTYIYIIYWTEC